MCLALNKRGYMLVSDFLANVRYRLADTLAERWATTRLIALVNDGLLDLAENSQIFSSKGYIVIPDQITEFNLEEKAVLINRVQYKEKRLPVKTHEEMDQWKISWMLDVGKEPEVAILNKQNRANFTIYPRVENIDEPSIEFSSPFGVITDISYHDFEIILVEDFGDIASIPDQKYLVIYFSKKQPKITVDTEEFEIDSFGESALSHFVTGMALRDNADTVDRAMAAEELARYYNLLDGLNKKKSTDFSIKSYNTPYVSI